MQTVDKQYKVIIGTSDFSDVISMDNGYEWTITSFSADSATGQDKNGNFHAPILGERVQLKFTAPEYITKKRLTDLVHALEFGKKGQRDIKVTYDDPLFGEITHTFYCTNLSRIKEKLPDYPYHYNSGVSIQMASTRYMNRAVVNDSPKIAPKFVSDIEYTFKLNGKNFNDIINIDGFKEQIIEQSLESKTGLMLDGRFEIPIEGSRLQNEIQVVEYLEIGRFRQLGKELGFGKKGERSHMVEQDGIIGGVANKRFYCTSISGTRVKLPDYPYHYMKDVKFQQAMKQYY